MKPATIAGRLPRWLMAAGLAFASFGIPQAAAQPVEEATPFDGLLLEEVRPLEPVEPEEPVLEAERPRLFFNKTGAQLDCDYVAYRLHFGIDANPAIITHPNFDTMLQGVRMDLSDQVPAGLSIVDVEVTGDIKGAGGGAAPTPIVGTTATPDDTLTIADLRLSGDDLDGDGSATRRSFYVKITAEIDHAAFPAPVLVDNQARIDISSAGGPGGFTALSHNPALPDDTDWKTGDPTTISIDVTDCEPPPPPPPPGEGGPCFEVATGEVDCAPGAGVFVYHMTVGAELAGNVIELTTTTPGITIAPPSQVVPPGGGVLSWTITGALPGDVIHLVAIGVETYAGPAEGVGLCCTQVIDIVIPEDLDCPDDDGEPDIRVDKRADDAWCTKDGPCDFTIRATNVGDAPYTGKIVLDEVTAPGNADVIAGPNAPWTCVPGTSPMSCEHPEVTLDPGEFVELELGFQPGPAWDWSVIRNCAEYDYTASGKGPFGDPANDKACASIPICIPGEDPECTPPEDDTPDIGVRKRAEPVNCTPDGLCTFVITVYNAGATNISAPVTFVDEFPAGDVDSATFSPAPPWSCVPLAGNTFQCDHPMLNLPSGATTDILVHAVVTDYPTPEVENCAEVEPLAGESNLANNRACARAIIPGQPEGEPRMRIEKTCDSAAGAAGFICRITVSNAGTAAPMGPVRVNDAAEIIGSGDPVTITSVTPDGAEWSCGAVPAETLTCEIPGAVMTPGASRHFDVAVMVSPNERFENCARGSYGPAPGDDIVYPIGEACDQGGTRISVEKTGDAQCLLGEPCTFEITISNDGPSGYSGPVRIGDAMTVEGFGGTPATILSVNPPFGCSPEPTELPFVCETNLTLGAGESRTHEVTVELPEDAALADEVGNGANGRNCVAVLGPRDDAVARELTLSEPLGERGDRVYDCHEFVVLSQEEQQCSPGLVMNDAGRCVCPPGTEFRNGECVGQQTIPTPTPRPTPTPQAEQCPPGTTGTPPNCRRIERRCPQGTTGTPPNCRPIVQRECPPGTTGQYPNCRKIEQRCPQGTTGTPPNCRPIVRPECPPGTTGTFPNCRRIERRCPQGTTGTPPNCRPIVQRECPPGTTGQYPNCRKIEQRCPQGTTGTPPNCRPIVQRRCPPGTTGQYPNCRKIQNEPPTLNRPQLRINPDGIRPLFNNNNNGSNQLR